jgi:hypothetical protein
VGYAVASCVSSRLVPGNTGRCLDMDFQYLTFPDMRDNDPPQTLYHYTSLEALVSIVQTKRFRASNIRFLNDTTESLRLKQDVIAILRRWISHSPDREDFRATLKNVETTPQQSLFIASLSERGDLLSQWRAYCPTGLGVSIGFSSDSLTEQWVANPRGDKPFFLSASLKKVKYYTPADQAQLEETLKKMLELEIQLGSRTAVAKMLTNLPEELLTKWIEAVIRVEGEPGFPEPGPFSAVAAWLAVLSPLVKHDAFEEEGEWRKVTSKQYRTMPCQRFRIGRSTLIPFVEIMLDVKTADATCVPSEKYFIDEVIVGPTPTPDLTIEAVRALFSSEGHPEVAVHMSRVPFRSW